MDIKYVDPDYKPHETPEHFKSESDKLLDAYYTKLKSMHNLTGKERLEAGWESTRLFNKWYESKQNFHNTITKERFGFWLWKKLTIVKPE